MRKIIAGIIMSFVIIFGATACGGPSISSGIIIEKEYWPAWQDTYLMPISTGNSTMMIPMTNFNPEEYHFKLRNCDIRDDEGNCAFGTVNVDPESYSRMNVGEQWN